MLTLLASLKESGVKEVSATCRQNDEKEKQYYQGHPDQQKRSWILLHGTPIHASRIVPFPPLPQTPSHIFSRSGSQVDVVASMGRPKDALDVAIRLFLLGLALPRAQAERGLGSDFLESADRLGMLGECPVDPLLLVSLVQLFPLDAEAMLPPTPPGGGQSQDSDQGLRAKHGKSSTRDIYSDGNSIRGNSDKFDGGHIGSGSSISGTESMSLDSRSSRRCCSKSRDDEAPPLTADGSQQEPEEGGNAAVVAGGRSQDREIKRGVVMNGIPAASGATATAAASHKPAGAVAALDLIFATDWPPPGSTAMTEEPVSESVSQSQRAQQQRVLSQVLLGGLFLLSGAAH